MNKQTFQTENTIKRTEEMLHFLGILERRLEVTLTSNNNKIIARLKIVEKFRNDVHFFSIRFSPSPRELKDKQLKLLVRI